MLRVLVADDSKAMRRVIARSLELAGLVISEVYEAESGLDALSLVRLTWLDLVLCDLYMPKMSGLELVRRMAEDHSTAEVPIVMVSAEQNRAQMDELKRLGVRGYVPKPFQPDALARAVQQALGLRSAS